MAKILIAEDEPDIRDLVAFTLRFAGHEVVAVANGAEAVEAAPLEMPDLILMDVRMPQMTGYEACEKIKADSRVKDIPVVFLSAKGQELGDPGRAVGGRHGLFTQTFWADGTDRKGEGIVGKVRQRIIAG